MYKEISLELGIFNYMLTALKIGNFCKNYFLRMIFKAFILFLDNFILANKATFKLSKITPYLYSKC